MIASKIEEALNWFKSRRAMNLSSVCHDCENTAIKSLEAWKNVLDDLDHAKENNPMEWGFSSGIKVAKEVINKHLNEEVNK